MSIAQKSMAFIAVIAVTVAIVFSFVATINVAQAAALTQTQISSIVSLLQSFGADANTIANVQASLNGQPTTPMPSTPSSSACTFTRDLTLGATGADVTCLQNALIAKGYGIAAGATGYFGAQTQAAVMKWQAAAGVSPAAGYFGAKSRAAFGSSSTTTGPTTPAPAGTGLTVMAGSQPMNALAVNNASRIPFTRITLTAGNDGDVVVNSVQVQRTGLGSDGAFAGVVLVDESTGMQVGQAKTFNSNHQAAVGQTMTIPRGTSKTFLIAGNMQANLASPTNYSGEAPSLSVVGVNTSATVSGTLPIVGATHVINSTLNVGTLSLDVSQAFSSNAPASKEIGTTAYKSTGFRLTAGSAEDVRLKSLTFNQTGSVSSGDLANVAIIVGGTSYPAVVSTDGKYYSATLGSGVVIPKGNQVEVYVQYDIIGSNATNRTVIFDVDKTTDIYATGETYGYGISPNTSGGSSVPTTRTNQNTVETTGTPYIYGAQVTVTGASVTTIGKANEVAAQNVALNVPNQPLGGYVVDLKGEGITVQSQVFNFNYSSGSAASNLLTNVTLVDANGTVVAGPVDAVNVAGVAQKVTFSDSVTYKPGRMVYTLRGKIPNTVSNGVTINASTTPSVDWSNVRGDVTGNTISLSAFSSQVLMNTMTIKAGSMVVNLSTSPASQTIVPGGQSQLFTNIQFDATQSGEDIRFSTAALTLTLGGSAAMADLTGCQLFDGATALNTGSNTLNPSGTSGATQTFTLDNPVTATKGTVKTLGLKCNVSGSAANAGTYTWAPITGPTFSGATSGTTIIAVYPTAPTITVTIGVGSVTVSTDASSPSYMLAAAGSTGVTNGVYKFRATNENINLTRIGLVLSNTASSSAGDVLKASIYNGATLVGEAYFIGSSVNATSTLMTPILLTKDQDKAVTIKLDYADVGSSQAVTFSGHLVAVNVDVGGTNTQGTGASSGATFNATGSTSVAGARVMKSYPTLALDTLSSTGIADGRLMRFKVTADAKGPVGIAQFALNLATSTASVTNVTIYGFTDANYSNPVSGVANDGNLQQTNDATVPATGNVTIGVANSSGATALQVPAGSTLYFEARGSVAGVASGASVTTKLLGSTSFPSTAAGVAANPLLSVSGVSDVNAFIWSPNSTTTVGQTGQDWTNGFGVTGLPSGGLIQTRSN
ncbi:peptidoglycan-binding protein [Patescibacteria group bacterium]|nr:peptidoglycan-binding protein [Patescibacteria group bacterium]